jgi:hypothetical protein
MANESREVLAQRNRQAATLLREVEATIRQAMEDTKAGQRSLSGTPSSNAQYDEGVIDGYQAALNYISEEAIEMERRASRYRRGLD